MIGRAESRMIVDDIRRTGRLRQVRDVLRPRDVFVLWRSGAPVWVQLMIADREGRLFRDGLAVAVREPARDDGAAARSTGWRLLNHAWDLLVFVLPLVVLFLVAVGVAVVLPRGPLRTTVLQLVLAGYLFWIAAVLTIGVGGMAYRLLRRDPAAMALGQLRTLNPTVALLHAPSTLRATALVARAVGHGDGPLLVLTDGITDRRPDRIGPTGLRIEPLSDRHPVLVARRPADPAPHAPSTPGRLRARHLAVILGGSAGALAIAAGLVTDRERAVCGAHCAEALTSYGDVLYWMANRLLGGDPDGLGAASAFGRVVGVLTSVYGLYVLVAIVGAVVRQRLDDDLRSAADVVAGYEAGRADGGYPISEPHAHGMLDVGDGQRLYWETCGDPGGAPAVVLHGGPGSGADRAWTGLLDPAAYRIVLVDQRGCGRSTPDAADPAVSLATNTTAHLVGDLERLRAHLGIDRWLVLGASWGSTLGLAYAQRHPRAVSAVVLFSVVGTTRQEIEWVTRGMARFLPEEWERFRAGVPRWRRHGNLAAAYARLLADADPDVRARAARAWCAWEERHVTATTGGQAEPRYADPVFRMRFARLVTHYWSHAAWLGDDELVRGCARLAGIPGVLVHGRADLSSPPDFAHRVHRAWAGSELVLVDGAGHGPGLQRAVIAATDRLRAL